MSVLNIPFVGFEICDCNVCWLLLFSLLLLLLLYPPLKRLAIESKNDGCWLFWLILAFAFTFALTLLLLFLLLLLLLFIVCSISSLSSLFSLLWFVFWLIVSFVETLIFVMFDVIVWKVFTKKPPIDCTTCPNWSNGVSLIVSEIKLLCFFVSFYVSMCLRVPAFFLLFFAFYLCCVCNTKSSKLRKKKLN